MQGTLVISIPFSLIPFRYTVCGGVSLTEVTSLKKIHSDLFKKLYNFSNLLGVGLCAYIPESMPIFYLAWSRVGLMDADTTVS